MEYGQNKWLRLENPLNLNQIPFTFDFSWELGLLLDIQTKTSTVGLIYTHWDTMAFMGCDCNMQSDLQNYNFVQLCGIWNYAVKYIGVFVLYHKHAYNARKEFIVDRKFGCEKWSRVTKSLKYQPNGRHIWIISGIAVTVSYWSRNTDFPVTLAFWWMASTLVLKKKICICHNDVIKWKHVPRLLAICADHSPVTGEFTAQRSAKRSFDVFFDLRLNKRLSEEWWDWWFETPSLPLWRNCKAQDIRFLMIIIPHAIRS